MTIEQQDYEHLSNILGSYVLRNGKRRRRFVYSELVQIARLRNTSLDTVTLEIANAVGELVKSPAIKGFIHMNMIPVRKTLIELLQKMAAEEQQRKEERQKELAKKRARAEARRELKELAKNV